MRHLSPSSRHLLLRLVLAGVAISIPMSSSADIVPITNSGFEDTTGQTPFNEFTFGIPAGWQAYNPHGVIGMSGVFPGTLMPNGIDFFNGPAPEGIRVGILFNSQQEGTGEYGFEQTLTETLAANTAYTLTAEVGNIASGFATNGTFFNLDEFPGYRIELLAGGTVIAADNNSLTIAEGEFATSTIQFTTAASHPLLGQALGIRLINLNVIPDGFTQATSPDLEVDFDRILLQATAIPEPSPFGLLIGAGMLSLMMTRYRVLKGTRLIENLCRPL